MRGPPITTRYVHQPTILTGVPMATRRTSVPLTTLPTTGVSCSCLSCEQDSPWQAKFSRFSLLPPNRAATAL